MYKSLKMNPFESFVFFWFSENKVSDIQEKQNCLQLHS